MACKNSLGRCRAEPDSAERRHTADETVGQHRHTFQRTAEEDAAEPGNIETAQLRQHVQCIGRVGLIFCDAAMDGVDLPGKPLVRKARAPARHHFDGLAQQHSSHGAGCRGVSDAHLTGSQQADARFLLLLHQPDAPADGLHSFSPAHSRAEGEVRCAGGDAAVEDARDRVARDAHIHRHHLAPGGLCHPADAGAAGGEVLSHGAGHAAVGLADALGHHTVIGAEHQHRPAGNIQLCAAGEGGGVLDGRFQSAQPAQRLCKAGPVGVRRRPGGFVRRRDGRTEGGEFCLSHGLSCNFQPRRQSAAAGAYPPSTNAGSPHRNARLQIRTATLRRPPAFLPREPRR